MPPPGSGLVLTEQEIRQLEDWLAVGAPYQQHWSFVPVRPPQLPPLQNSNWPRNPIDRFVLAQLRQRGLVPSPPAEPLTLLRRVSFDLTGMPPTPEAIDAFLTDRSSRAYENAVDRLLASPRYGEHMALGWLEAARYADTSGYQADWERFMWPWRNWVIAAYNQDMPFDQFTIEQLAGDLLPGATFDQILATGFNRNHRINDEGGVIAEEYAVEYVVDRVDTTCTVWLGLTMGCARCHDHKYDPLTQADFYQLFSIFNNVPEKGKDGREGFARPAVEFTDPEIDREIRRVQRRIAELQEQLKLASAVGDDSSSQPSEQQLDELLERTGKLRDALRKLEAKRTVHVMVMRELSKPRETYILVRGQYDQPDKDRPALPQIPGVFGSLPTEAANRLGFAKWLVSSDNPLTARVAVNRYWQMHFGQGFVKTTEDFGSQGTRPSHPQLLDWLAAEFVRSGWDVKAMHRLIVTSATYRQSSRTSPELLEKDPQNVWLARGPRFRLSAQAIRDQALAAGGLLVNKIGGPSVKPYQPPGLWAEVSFQDKQRSTDFYVQDHGDKLYRRSLYTFWKRSVAPPQMVTFDAAGRETCRVRLSRTSTPLQALTLMNDVTFVEAARGMAVRMLSEAGSSQEERLRYGLKLVAATPDPAVLVVLHAGLARYLEHFRRAPEATNALLAIGESDVPSDCDTVELAAYTAVASVILNLDQTITKE